MSLATSLRPIFLLAAVSFKMVLDKDFYDFIPIDIDTANWSSTDVHVAVQSVKGKETFFFFQ